MSTNLVTEAALAEMFELDPEQIVALRRRHRWPHVKLGRWDVRYTNEQVAQIIRQHSVTGDTTLAISAASGLTPRSAGRAS